MHAHDDSRPWDLLVSPWHLDEELQGFPVPDGATPIGRPPGPATGRPEELVGRYRAVADAVADAAHPLVLSGDCLAAVACVAGLQRRSRDVTVMWLDAHGDFNTPAISTSGYLAGMSLATVTGRVPEPIADGVGLRPVPDDRVVLIGARDLDDAEREQLDASGVRQVAADPTEVARVVGDRAAGEVYLHVDVDVIDGDDVPGLQWTTSDGPCFSVVEDCLARIVESVTPAAVCIASPWTPEAISNGSARQALSRLAAVIGPALQWPTDDDGAAER